MAKAVKPGRRERELMRLASLSLSDNQARQHPKTWAGNAENVRLLRSPKGSITGVDSLVSKGAATYRGRGAGFPSRVIYTGAARNLADDAGPGWVRQAPLPEDVDWLALDRGHKVTPAPEYAPSVPYTPRNPKPSARFGKTK